MHTKASLASLLTVVCTVSLGSAHSPYEAATRFLNKQLEMYPTQGPQQIELFDL